MVACVRDPDSVRPLVDTALAAVDAAAVVFTVRRAFARRHVLAEARRHLGETLRGRAFARGLDDYVADQALARPLVDRRHRRQATARGDLVRAGPGRQPRPAELDPHRPHRTRRHVGRGTARDRVGRHTRRRP
ncbi:hypothetical protein ACFS5L_45165 [Streptomyces phyllanthi]|uniref:hypothetical protein n=1 Tax=Streptomyces phyllanthi TaxID=1803180 RepID=UPI00188365BD|nr:hypothetical protein [Streptomyces phyllanthi]